MSDSLCFADINMQEVKVLTSIWPPKRRCKTDVPEKTTGINLTAEIFLLQSDFNGSPGVSTCILYMSVYTLQEYTP